MNLKLEHKDFLWFAELFGTWGVEEMTFLRFGEAKGMSSEESMSIIQDLVEGHLIVRRGTDEYQPSTDHEDEESEVKALFYLTKKRS